MTDSVQKSCVNPVSKDFNEYAHQVMAELKKNDIRTESDVRDESLSKKIRMAEKRKIKYMLIAGEKEKESGQVSLRVHKMGDKGKIGIDELISKLKLEIEKKE